MKPDIRQPRTIPNPLYCETCEGRGYVVHDAEWEPIAVRCPDPKCPVAFVKKDER